MYPIPEAHLAKSCCLGEALRCLLDSPSSVSVSPFHQRKHVHETEGSFLQTGLQALCHLALPGDDSFNYNETSTHVHLLFFVSSFLVGVSNLAAKWQVSVRSSSWTSVSPSHLLLSPVYSDLSHFLGVQLKEPAQSEREKKIDGRTLLFVSLMQTLPILTVLICKYQEIAIWTHHTMAGHGCSQRNWESI